MDELPCDDVSIDEENPLGNDYSDPLSPPLASISGSSTCASASPSHSPTSEQDGSVASGLSEVV